LKKEDKVLLAVFLLLLLKITLRHKPKKDKNCFEKA